MARSGEEVTQPGDGSDEPSAGETSRLGQRIGRYVIRERIGSGGMGVVFAAWDPELDREVAIKLLYPGRSLSRTRREALRREARALARLNHPNVVTILHVGEDEGQLYVVMERVRGSNFDVWLRARPRDARHIVEVLRQAGDGLAAAHRAGVVHRDFKPANIMLSPQEGRGDPVGRVRVMDFGLARLEAIDPTEAGSGSFSRDPLTAEESGSNLQGTPAYMAPEQFDDAMPDARSDQYAFCVTAYEALAGHRPFSGESPIELAMSQERTQIPSLVRPGLPHRAAAAIERGLSRAPEQRWPDLDALLRQLEPQTGRDRKVVGTVLATVFLGLGVAWLATSDETDFCARLRPPVEAWPHNRERIRQVFADSDASHAASTAASVVERLDAYADDWTERDQALCRGAGDHSKPVPLLDERRACLDRALGRFGALAEVLARGDEAAIDRASGAVDDLPSPASCDDPQWLQRRDWLEPPDDESEQLREQLDLIDAEVATGAYDSARARLDRLRDGALESGRDRTLAEIDLRAGEIEKQSGNYARARDLLERSYFAALTSGDEPNAFWAALLLINVYGETLADIEAANTWTEHASALVERIGDPILGARLDLERAIVSNRQSDYETAAETASRGLSRLATIDAPDSLRAGLHSSMGAALARAGRLEEAAPHFDRAYQLETAALGEDHPVTSFAAHNLATIWAEQGRFDEAVPLFERVLSVRERAFGAASPRVADVLANMSASYCEMGDPQTCLKHGQRALDIYTDELGLDHPRTMAAQQNLGLALLDLERSDDARPLLEQVVRGFEKFYGADHFETAIALHNLAAVDLAQRRHDDALRHIDRAHQIITAASETPDKPRHHIAFRRSRALAELRRCKEAAEALAPVLTTTPTAEIDCTDHTTAQTNCPNLPTPKRCQP